MSIQMINRLIFEYLKTHIYIKYKCTNGQITILQMEKFDKEKYKQKQLECYNEKNLEGLFNLALFNWETLNATRTPNESFPEICYYFGRLRKVEELSSFFQKFSLTVNFLSTETLEMGQELFEIGFRFPNLNESDMYYLEGLYTDSRTYQFMKFLMFDEDRLPRTLLKYDTTKLKIKNTEFSEELLLKVFECFEINEENENTYNDCLVYSRELNDVIEKSYSQISIDEFYISEYSINYKTCLKICSDIFNEKIEKKLFENINNDYSHLGGVYPKLDLSPNEFIRYVESVDLPETKDNAKMNELKKTISLKWLRVVNDEIIHID